MHYTLGDQILDLIQNSVEAQAHTVLVELDQDERNLRVKIEDDGKGMDREELARATDPFYSAPGKHRGRRVGLGLPFLVQTLESTGGEFAVESEPGRGTRLVLRFDLTCVDTPPPGDLAGAFLQGMLFEGGYELIVRRIVSAGDRRKEYEVRRSELEEALGGLSESGALLLAKRYLCSREEDISGHDGPEKAGQVK